jgi:hypothetical protein
MKVSGVSKLHMITNFSMEIKANGLLPILYVLVIKELDSSLGLSL